MFSARFQHVLSFSQWPHHFLATFSKVHEFVQNSVFSLTSACFVIFALGTPLFNVFSKVHEFVQNSVFSRRSARFNIFALGAPLFTDFQQRASVCPKQRFLPKISTFPYFCTGETTFKHCHFFWHCQVLSFLHWAHHLLVIVSKVHEFLQNSVFSPRSACFVIFTLGTPLLSVFSKVHEFV